MGTKVVLVVVVSRQLVSWISPWAKQAATPYSTHGLSQWHPLAPPQLSRDLTHSQAPALNWDCQAQFPEQYGPSSPAVQGGQVVVVEVVVVVVVEVVVVVVGHTVVVVGGTVVVVPSHGVNWDNPRFRGGGGLPCWAA